MSVRGTELDTIKQLVDNAATPLYGRIEYAARLAGLPDNADASEKYIALLNRGPSSRYMQMIDAVGRYNAPNEEEKRE